MYHGDNKGSPKTISPQQPISRDSAVRRGCWDGALIAPPKGVRFTKTLRYNPTDSLRELGSELLGIRHSLGPHLPKGGAGPSLTDRAKRTKWIPIHAREPLDAEFEWWNFYGLGPRRTWIVPHLLTDCAAVPNPTNRQREQTHRCCVRPVGTFDWSQRSPSLASTASSDLRDYFISTWPFPIREQ